MDSFDTRASKPNAGGSIPSRRAVSPSGGSHVRSALALARTQRDLYDAGIAAGLTPLAARENVARCIARGRS